MWISSRLSLSWGDEETRAERAEERVSDDRVAWRFCSSRKLGILSRPPRVSDRQFRRVFSSVVVLVVLTR